MNLRIYYNPSFQCSDSFRSRTDKIYLKCCHFVISLKIWQQRGTEFHKKVNIPQKERKRIVLVNLLISLFSCQCAYVAYGKMSLIKLAPLTFFFFFAQNPSQPEIIITARWDRAFNDSYKTEKSLADTPLSSIMEVWCLLSTVEEVTTWHVRTGKDVKDWHTI